MNGSELMGHPLEIPSLPFIVNASNIILIILNTFFMIGDISVHKLHMYNDKLDVANFLIWKRVHSVQALQ